MKDFLNEGYLAAVGYDLVIEDESTKRTYFCALDRSKADANSNTPIEQQNCWSIRCVIETTLDSITTTEIMYPNGSRRYEFAAASCSEYNYIYKI